MKLNKGETILFIGDLPRGPGAVPERSGRVLQKLRSTHPANDVFSDGKNDASPPEIGRCPFGTIKISKWTSAFLRKSIFP